MKKNFILSAAVKAMAALMFTGVFSSCAEGMLDASYGAQEVKMVKTAPADTIPATPAPATAPADTLLSETLNKGISLTEAKEVFGFDYSKKYSVSEPFELSSNTNAPLSVSGGSLDTLVSRNFDLTLTERESEIEENLENDGSWSRSSKNTIVSFTASNGEVSVSFVDSLSAPRAKFEHDSLTVSFEYGVWSREVSLDTASFTVVIDGDVRSAKSFVWTVDYTYSVPAELAQPNVMRWQTRHEVVMVSPAETKVQPVVPAAAPRFTGMAVSAVPALAVNGKPVDGSERREAWWSFLFFEEGAVTVVVVPFGTIPTAEEVAAGFHYEGDFTGCNSALDAAQNGVWSPAIAQTTIKENGQSVLKWYVKGESDVKRSIRHASLSEWGWKNVDGQGRYTTVVDGYSYSFEGENMVVSYNGQVVLTLN